MGNVSRKMEILKKKQKEMLKNRKTLTEMKTAFSTLIYKHVTAEERLWGFVNRYLQNWKAERTKTENNRKIMEQNMQGL